MVSRASISIVIPTYNRALLVSRAIRSVLAAIQDGDEILVIDDGSTDNTEQEVRSFGEPVRYHRIANAGPGATRNTGIGLARHDLIAFLDSDDEYCPDKLQLQRQVMQKYPDLVFCFGNLAHQDTNGVILHDLIGAYQKDGNIGSPFPTKHAREIFGPAIPFSSVCELPTGVADFGIHIGKFSSEMMDVHYTHVNTVLIRRSLAGSACRFPEDVRLMEDWEFMIALARKGSVAFLDREVAIMNGHDDARLVYVPKINHMDARLRVLERCWEVMSAKSDDYWTRHEALVRFYRLKRAKLLLNLGRLVEARADFQAARAPLEYRLFAHLPAFIALPAYRARLQLKKRLRLNR